MDKSSLFYFVATRTWNIDADSYDVYRAWYNGLYTMMVKPILKL